MKPLNLLQKYLDARDYSGFIRALGRINPEKLEGLFFSVQTSCRTSSVVSGVKIIGDEMFFLMAPARKPFSRRLVRLRNHPNLFPQIGKHLISWLDSVELKQNHRIPCPTKS